jgi:predicted nucleotidyltransferase
MTNELKVLIDGTGPFITGSVAYGTPTAESDIDLVVLMDTSTARRLNNMADAKQPDSKIYSDDVDIQFRFGKLNIIACYEPEVFQAWRKGTLELAHRRPVTRDDAKEVLKPMVDSAQDAARKRKTLT